jgi:type IV pilus assembly protein PilM
MPSALAALAALESSEPVLAACLSKVAITTSITRGDDLLLYRTLDLPQDSLQRMVEIQRSIAVAAAYFEDKLGARPCSLHYTGILKVADFSRTVADPTFNVVEWVQKPESILTPLPQTSFAAVAGALAGAR